MLRKRLRSGKTLDSEEIAGLSLSAKEQLFSSANMLFVETMCLPAEFSDISGGINETGYKIMRIGHDFNEFFEVSAGKAVFDCKKTELKELLSGLAERSGEFLERKETALIFRSYEKGVFVNIDRERFYYAVLNLLLNAAENTPRGGKVRVVLQKTKKFAKITVQDNGFGMDEETLLHCFEPFYTKSRSTEKKKMGLGLTLAHFFAVKSGGRLGIKSEEGKGTSVSLLIPLMTAEEIKLSVEALGKDIFGGNFSPVSIVLSGIEKE